MSFEWVMFGMVVLCVAGIGIAEVCSWWPAQRMTAPSSPWLIDREGVVYLPERRVEIRGKAR